MRLGRGLSSLLSLNGDVSPTAQPAAAGHLPDSPAVLPDTVRAAEPATESLVSGDMRMVEISRVIPNARQPRRTFDEASLANLADSIRAAGVIQPIIVRPFEGNFQLVAGERRWRAAKLAGLDQIPVIIRNLDAAEQSQLALIENIHREALNPIDRALAYRAMIQQLGLTHQELATRLGEERSSVANLMRLLDLDEKVREMVAAGAISTGHAKILAGVADLAEQLRLAELVVAQELSVRKLEQLLKQSTPIQPPAPRKPSSAHIQDLERQISRDLQMRTEVRQGARGQKGKLVIHYASLDQFDQLLQRLNIRIED